MTDDQTNLLTFVPKERKKENTAEKQCGKPNRRWSESSAGMYVVNAHRVFGAALSAMVTSERGG